MEYKPEPQETSNITLSRDIAALVEKLAENTHKVWALRRIKEGWTYGECRDDANKRHPCLVPYNDLPESEKEYDRSVSLETLKLIIAMGYKIEKEC